MSKMPPQIKKDIDVTLINLNDELVTINRKFMRGEIKDHTEYEKLIKKNRKNYQPEKNITHVMRVSLNVKKQPSTSSPKEEIFSLHDFAKEASMGFSKKLRD